ncbi:MAG: GNVR domain-containing protein [Desulfuromonadaceae bacterium]|nr:GNVR domain-containing protein [Desulfuromonadaceae bacterium]
MNSYYEQVKNYLQILYNRRYLFLIVAVSVSLAIIIGSFFSAKQYEAKSTVFIEKNVVNSLLQGLTVTPSMSDRIRVLRYHMLSRDIISRVLKKMDMDVKMQTPAAFEGLIRQCQEKTNINMKGDDLFFVSLVSSDQRFARDYINTLVHTYVEENISSKREESFGADRFLSEQVKFYKQKLNKVEDEIYVYRKKTGIFSTVTEASIIENMDKLEEAIRALQGKKNELMATARTINEQLTSMQNAASSGRTGITGFDMFGGSVDEMRLEAMQSQLDALLMLYNDSYPAIVRLRYQIQALENSIALNEPSVAEPVFEVFNPVEDPIFVDLKMRMNSAQSDLNALKAREQELKTQIYTNKEMLEKFPQDKKALAEMERERAMVKNVYETLLQRVGMAEVSKQMEISDKATTFRIVDPAILPTVPVGVKRLYKMFFGVLVGIGVAIGIVVVREQLDDTVRNADVLRSKGITVIAEIPLMFSEEDTLKRKKWDRLVYTYSGICLGLITLLLLHDVLGFSFLDRLVAAI